MEFIWGILSECTPYIITLLALLILSEQISYLKRKRFAPGPTMVIPFMGNAVSLVRNPKKFWDNQSALAQSTPLGVSTNYVFGKFIVYIYSTEFSLKVFSNVRPDAFQLTAYPFGKKLWGERNIIYLFGQEHKDLRQRIAPNFTPKGIAFYNSIQQCIILKHFKSWLLKSSQKPIPLRLLSRYMNLDISQSVFVGEYLSDEERKMFNIGFDIFNEATMKLPINLPGFAFRNARSSHAKIIQMLAVCISKSEMKMKNSEEPTCLLDFWMLENLKVLKAEAEGKGVLFEYSHEELAAQLFDLLFAAQDASTSSLIWAVTLLDAHPDVLQRVRLEVAKYWNPESNEPITVENLREMKFTEAVAKEVLRIRPPASMVPHIAQEDFALTENYVIPKGTIVFPSVIDSCFQGFPEPEKFDPDRFMDERQEDKVYKRNFLAFGVGPHQCVGQRYALNHLKLFIAMFATLMEFKRERVDGCDDIVYLPSTFPKDHCSVILSQRCKRFPSLS